MQYNASTASLWADSNTSSVVTTMASVDAVRQQTETMLLEEVGNGFASHISSSYTVIIIVLSLVVITTIGFTICGLFMKAVAHQHTEMTVFSDGLLFTDKDATFSMFSLHSDV